MRISLKLPVAVHFEQHAPTVILFETYSQNVGKPMPTSSPTTVFEPGLKNLSERERQILGLASAGLLDKNIAAELGISENTLRTYWKRIREKNGNLTRAALSAEYAKGLAAPPGSDTAQTEALLGEIGDPEILRRVAIYYATVLARAQQMLARAARAAHVLASYPRLTQRARNVKELFRSTCRALVEDGGFTGVWIGFPVNNEERSVKMAESCGSIGEYLKGLRLSWGEGPLGKGPGGIALRTGKTVAIRDFLADPRTVPWREEALKAGFQSSIGIPLRRNSTTFGLLSIYEKEPHGFEEGEIGVLEQIARCLSQRIVELGIPGQMQPAPSPTDVTNVRSRVPRSPRGTAKLR